MICNYLIDNRIFARHTRCLEKYDCAGDYSASGTDCERKPRRKGFLFRFASHRRANLPAQMRWRAIRRRIARQGLAQCANLFLRTATLFTPSQMLFDLARVDQIKLAISVSMKEFADFVVVHFVLERIS